MKKPERKKGILIFGCGGHGRSIADVLFAGNPRGELAFVDPAAGEDETIMGCRTFRHMPAAGSYSCIIGVGDNRKRQELFLMARDHSRLEVISVLSKLSYVGKFTHIGEGCFAGNYCHIGPEAKVGNNTILNTACVVDHGVVIGEHCHIGPNATISGWSTIGDFVFVGVGATVIDRVSICSHVVIGAGSTVVRNIDEPGVYAGSPVRRLRSLEG